MRKKGFQGSELKIGFWSALKAYTILNFDNFMKDIKDVDVSALNWLNKIPFEHWFRLMFDYQIKVENVTNNIAQSFNSWVRKYRSLQIVMLA